MTARRDLAAPAGHASPGAGSCAADLYVAPSHRHERGVFAARRFPAGAVIERCPVLVISAEVGDVEDSGLHGYLYEWEGEFAIALGFGSLYNHSFTPNAEYEAVVDERLLVIRARRSIEAADEITVSYVDSTSPGDLWFTARD